MGRLEELVDAGEISEYVKCTIMDMSNKVLEHIARKYENVREGVKLVMGGKVLDYEAKRIKSEGKLEGKLEQLVRQICKKLQKGKTAKVIAEELEEELAEVEKVVAAQKKLGSYDVEAICKALVE